MRLYALTIFLLVLLAPLTGCATTDVGSDSDRDAHAATDVPDRFLVGTPTGTATTEPAPGEGCRNPMVDPRDRARLVLVRSREGRGDYEVPAGRYGVGERELLRLECETGRVIGIVRR